MTAKQVSAGYVPLTLDQTREALALDASALMARLGALAQAPRHNCVIAADFTARPGVAAGPLAGIPVGIKDNIDAEGFATTGGSCALRGHRAAVDSPAVAALRAAGAVIACKLNMHEMAFGVTTDNPTFGRAFNPFDAGRTAGGSSGGSASAVARGIVPVALGTDTGGSVRIPASFCGVVGLRPSTGRYPAGGTLPLSPSRDTVGPIAACVADIAALDAVITGEALALPDLPARKLRLGLPADALPGLSATVEVTFRAAIDHLVSQGLAEIVALPDLGLAGLEREIGFPIVLNEAHAVWTEFCATELGCTLAEFAEILGDAHVRDTFTNMPSLKAQTAARYEAIIGQEMAELRARIAALYEDHAIDLMVMPTAVVQPPRWEEGEVLKVNGSEHPTFFTVVRNAALATLTGAPSLSLPAGLDGDGLPVGIMLDAPVGQDRMLLAWAARIEASLPRIAHASRNP